MTDQTIYISNEGKKNQRMHKSIVLQSGILNEIDYSEDIKIPTKLIKYYSLKDYNIEAVTKNYLFASDPLTFNDPFDCPIQLWDPNYFSFEIMEEMINPDFNKIISRNNLLNRDHFFKFYLSFVGIICMNEFSEDNQDMIWGYYSNQEGFAVSFRQDKLINFGNPYAVEYLDRYDLDFFYYNKNEDLGIPKLFPKLLRWMTQKKVGWRIENEWRFVIFNPIQTLSFEQALKSRKTNYDIEAIEEIQLGLRFFKPQNIVFQNSSKFIYIINDQTSMQNKLLSFLSVPSTFKIKHMSMKYEKLIFYPRECQICQQEEGKYLVEYLE